MGTFYEMGMDHPWYFNPGDHHYTFPVQFQSFRGRIKTEVFLTRHMNRVHYSECPVCSSRSIDPLLTVKDHSVSKENFVISQCKDCSLRFTQDVPDEGSIGSYYQSAD